MDPISLISSILALFYIGILVYLANQNDLEQARYVGPDAVSFHGQQRVTIVRWMLFGVISLTFIFGLLLIQMALISSSSEAFREFDMELPQIDTTTAIISFGVALVVSVFCFRLVMSGSTRLWLQRFTGQGSRYNPDSSVHLVALVLVLCFLSVMFSQFAFIGGLSGLAEDVAASGIGIGELIFQGVLLVVLSLLGVGMAIRRDVPQTFERLGLQIPSSGDVIVGVGAGIVLFFVSQILFVIWSSLVPADQLLEQSAASEQITMLFSTIPMAFLLAVIAAVSEEILFRGAMQPVFGLGLTSVFFALFHNQYLLTPATLIVFIVGAGMGIIRQRRNTNAAIIAHFIYNFFPFLLASMLPQ